MPSQGPFDLPAHVEDAVGPLSRRLVVNRRGSTVWDVRTATGRCAIKLGYRSRTHEWTALAPARATGTAVPTQEADV